MQTHFTVGPDGTEVFAPCRHRVIFLSDSCLLSAIPSANPINSGAAPATAPAAPKMTIIPFPQCEVNLCGYVCIILCFVCICCAFKSDPCWSPCYSDYYWVRLGCWFDFSLSFLTQSFTLLFIADTECYFTGLVSSSNAMLALQPDATSFPPLTIVSSHPLVWTSTIDWKFLQNYLRTLK